MGSLKRIWIRPTCELERLDLLALHEIYKRTKKARQFISPEVTIRKIHLLNEAFIKEWIANLPATKYREKIAKELEYAKRNTTMGI